MNKPLQPYGILFTKYLAPFRLRSMVLSLLVLFTIILQLVNPQIIKYFINAVLSGGKAGVLISSAAVFLGASLLVQGVGVLSTYIGEDIGWRITNRMRSDLLSHCLHLDMSFHNTSTPGEMVERIDGDISNISNFFSQFIVRMAGNLILLIGVLVVLALEDWRVSLALLGSTTIGIIGLAYLRQVAVPFWKMTRESKSDLSGFLEEQLAGTEDVRSNKAESYVIRNLFKLNKILMDNTMKSGSTDASIVVMWVSIHVLGQAVAFLSSYALFTRGLITVGGVYLVVYYTYFAFQRLIEVAGQIQNFQLMAASIQRIGTLRALKSKISEPPVPLQLPSGALGIVFDSVTFGYNKEGPVLQDVSFSLQPGKILGVLGRTGSGKTSLVRLLFRLYDPDLGSICFYCGEKGQAMTTPYNIREVAEKNLRNRIGMVTQTVQLFKASIRDNITIFDSLVRDEKIYDVIRRLGLTAWYEALPDGLDTILESGGKSLSAGEAQLLAFTRVFLQDPGLVILDEASSRLDPVTEKFIEQAVERLLVNRTGIIIAHHLSTIRKADQIMIIENGRVKELGDRSLLAGDATSRFSALLRKGTEEVHV
jgi:ATP-binding cassette subfamily B protein